MKTQELVWVGAINHLVRAAIEFASDDRALCLFSGTVGCGKTHAADVAMRLHWLSGELVTAWQLSRLAPWDDEIDRLLALQGVLVIDDVGTEFELKAGRFTSLLDGLVNTRESRRRKTVITTNLSGQVFRERFGGRVFDRIKGDDLVVTATGESLRGKANPGVEIWRYPLKPDRRDFELGERADSGEQARIIDMGRAMVDRLTALKATERNEADNDGN